MKKLLVAIDFSDASAQVVEKLSQLMCSNENTKVYLMHILEPSICYDVTGVLPDDVPYPVIDSDERTEVRRNAAQCLHSYAEQLRSLANVEVEEIISDEFEVSESIIHYAKEHHMDTIVLGKHGRGFLESVLIGSVATSVVRSSPIPVLVIPVQKEK
jgi:nucleotide-binding universal stress UspA family protein